MRWVDIDELEFPDGWQTRADKALNELRKEIEDAEQAARLAGEDIAAARKTAITEGLKKKSRQQVWRELAKPLSVLQKGKCWYSESKNPTSDKDVDHFRPKNRVAEDPDHEGYWWLAFNWRNYRYSCQWCNQRRVDAANGTDGGKLDRFPVAPGSFRARLEGDNWRQEEVELLDPIDPEDWKLLTFLRNGQPTPAKDKGTREYDRAATSILVYHLNCRELVVERMTVASTIRQLVESMDIAYSKIIDPDMKAIYKSQQKNLLRAINHNSPYSAAALAYARDQIYKVECGHLVKRQWLEDILNLK
ncbi:MULTISPECIES: hypothetical protein [unclassified Microcoleus]|uniref:hypothetical protein n=1 Tax=unclassified Microcoleus TaxID=2642155 RepID=UPI002FD797D5